MRFSSLSAILFSALAGAAWGCGNGSGDTDACQAGTIGCECVLGTCEVGLNCSGAICTGPQSESSGTESSGAESSGTGGQVDPVCEQYLSCLEAVAPDQLDNAQAAFGAEGPCWESASSAEQCVMACEAGVQAQLMGFPNEPACGGMLTGCEAPWATKDPASTAPDLMQTWGAPCASDQDCVGILGQSDAICVTQIFDTYTVPGGMCTRPCTLPNTQTTFVNDAADCDPAGGISCVGAQGLFSICAPPCTQQENCSRDAYGCSLFPQIAVAGDPEFCLMNAAECCVGAGC